MAFAPSHAIRWQATRVVAKANRPSHAALLRHSARRTAVPKQENGATSDSAEQHAPRGDSDVMRRMAETIKRGEKKTLWQSWRSLSFGQRLGIASVIAVVGAAGMFISDYLELMYPSDGDQKYSAIAMPKSQPKRLIGITVVDRAVDGKAEAGRSEATA